MAISKTKNYLVLNYNMSPVAVKTKYDSFLIDASVGGAPGSLPLTIDEIQVINSNSPVFKVGLLRFEECEQADIYETLRIEDWQDIMTDTDIKDILLNPTVVGLQKILNIESDIYFERVRGIFMGLKNSGADLSIQVCNVIDGRRAELVAHKRKSEIQVRPSSDRPKQVDQKEVEDLKRQLDEMRKMMAEMKNSMAPVEDNAEDVKPAAKPRTKSTKKETNSSK